MLFSNRYLHTFAFAALGLVALPTALHAQTYSLPIPTEPVAAVEDNFDVLIHVHGAGLPLPADELTVEPSTQIDAQSSAQKSILDSISSQIELGLPVSEDLIESALDAENYCSTAADDQKRAELEKKIADKKKELEDYLKNLDKAVKAALDNLENLYTTYQTLWNDYEERRKKGEKGLDGRPRAKAKKAYEDELKRMNNDKILGPIMREINAKKAAIANLERQLGSLPPPKQCSEDEALDTLAPANVEAVKALDF